MLLKRKVFLTFFCIFMTCCFLICFLICFCFFIPSCLNSNFFHQVVSSKGLQGFSWDVRRLGLNGFDIGSLQIGVNKQKALSIKSIQVNYLLSEIYKKNIKNFLITGLEFNCGIKNDKFFIQGFDLENFLNSLPTKTSPSSNQTKIPLTFENFEIQNSFITFQWQQKSFKIPLTLKLISQNQNVLHGVFKIFPRGQEIKIVFNFNIYEKIIDLTINSNDLYLERFTDLTSQIPELKISGKVNLNITSKLKLNPFEICFINTQVEFYNTNTSYNSIKLKNIHSPLRLNIETNDLKTWNISASSIKLKSYVNFNISQINAKILKEQDKIQCIGDIICSLEKSKSNTSFNVIEPLVFKAEYLADYSKNNIWNLRFKSLPLDVNFLKPVNVQIGKTFVSANRPEVKIHANGSQNKVKVNYNIKIPKFYVKSGQSQINIPDLIVKGTSQSGVKGIEKIKLNLNADNTKMEIDKTKIKMPALLISGNLDKNFCFNGLVKAAKANVYDIKSKTKIAGIKAYFPFQWPWQKTKNKGSISIKSMKIDKLNLGSATGFISQDRSGLKIGGKYFSKLIPDCIINFNGRSEFLNDKNKTQIKFDSVYKKTTPMEIGKLYPEAKGIDIKGILKLNGSINIDNTGINFKLDSILDHSDIWLKKQNTALKNIKLKFSLVDLFPLRSEPKQELTIGSISIGKIFFSDAKIDFQLESDQSVLIEKANFKWCGGSVNSESLRIKPGIEDYDLILYCDRLNLADLLMQLGAAKAEGQGAVSGRIPVRFKDNEINFDDGFLFSTPGDGGTIHITGAEMLTQGISDTVQYNQIELAREALKDYEYKWVKLRLNSEDKNLRLKINFDGKPSKPLPFIYKEDFGGFVRVKSGKQLSNFQGIRLNVNLELPLNEILKHKGIFDKINK